MDNPQILLHHLLQEYLVERDIKSKKISNDQELIQSDPTSCPKTKREITKYINWRQFMKGTRGKPNEQLLPNRWSFSYLKFTKYVTNIIAEPKYKYGQQEQVTVRNHNRSTPWNGQYKNTGGLKPVLRDPNLALSFHHASKHTVVRSAWRFSNSSMDHHGKQMILWWSKDEDSTGMCCDRHPEIPGVSNNTTGTLEQKKTNSWTPVGQATDKKAPAQTN